VKKFKIPSKLNEIQKISDPDHRLQKLLALVQTMDISFEDKENNSKGSRDESVIIKELRKAHKEFVSSFFAAIGFVLILLSGISAVVRSFN
jgi:hypothetical protein